ncbi:MAG: glycerol-3-phosphate 1-O-acyltransferase PlsY [Dehalococcoidia bacterium]|nr:glycerol-3-phosphate 1-O-acyltransferase PlsY [Dehalococcoidia bacterium]
MAFDSAIIILIGYLLGAIPFGLLIGKLTRGIDVREYGSGNIGFANVFRTCGAKAGLATFVLDIVKGTLAAWLGGKIIGGDHMAVGQVMGALAAVLGHNWPVYLKFKGGKGVDTSVGGLIAMSPWIGFASLAIGLVVILITRYVSVGSMTGSFSSIPILIPFVVTGNQPAEYLIYCVIVTILIVYRHRDNIANLRAGTEHKLGQKGEKR